MPRHGEEVSSQRLHVDRDLADGRSRIGMEEGAVAMCDCGEFGDRLNRADFVVRVHDAHQQRVGPDQPLEILGINAGYLAVALAALGAGYMAAELGPRSGPVWIGGTAALLGVLFTVLFVRDTGDHVELEHSMADQAIEGGHFHLNRGTVP